MVTLKNLRLSLEAIAPRPSDKELEVDSAKAMYERDSNNEITSLYERSRFNTEAKAYASPSYLS